MNKHKLQLSLLPWVFACLRYVIVKLGAWYLNKCVFDQNAFSTVANSDPHQALSFDRLHNYPGGLAKSHLVPLILNRFKSSSKQTVALKSKIEKRCVTCRCSITD